LPPLCDSACDTLNDSWLLVDGLFDLLLALLQFFLGIMLQLLSTLFKFLFSLKGFAFDVFDTSFELFFCFLNVFSGLIEERMARDDLEAFLWIFG
jgi:hypothetical protein